MDSLDFESRDLDEVATVVSGLYSRMRFETTSSPSTTRVRHRAFGPSLTVAEVEHGTDFRYRADPHDDLVLCQVRGGTVSRDDAGADVVDGTGAYFAVHRPEHAYAGVVRGVQLRIVSLGADALDELAPASGTAGRPVRLVGHHPVSARRAAGLGHSLDYLFRHVLHDGSDAGDLVLSTARRHLAAQVLEAFPSTAEDGPTATDRRDAHPATLRRALALVEGDPSADLGVADLARAAQVTPRALQLAFRRHLGTTPLAHLRRVRLDQARADLLAADAADGTTVRAVAGRWGFVHPGRFATAYRAAYGESPGATLRR